MEEAKNARRFPRWAETLLIWCVPTLVILLLYVYVIGLVFDWYSFLTFCAILALGLIITRVIFVLRSDRIVSAKVWRCVLWLLLLVVFWFFSLFLPRVTHHVTGVDAPGRFEAELSQAYPMSFPDGVEIGSPQSAELHRSCMSAFIFRSRSYTLLCRYDAAEYEAEKTALETRYMFRTEPLLTEYPIRDETVQTIEPYALIGNDVFRFVRPVDGDSDMFFKKCLLVVTNDVEREIGYIVFDDFDLDYARDLTEFLNNECGWKNIR